jgi:DMSO/TMAO reductase YedYZ molybdopterin-dependent catalytic subunit
MDSKDQLTRRGFLRQGGIAAAALSLGPYAHASEPTDRRIREAAAKLEYLTPMERAFILDKGKTGILKLPPERLREIGLVPETWSLEVVPDPGSSSIVQHPLSKALGNALNWDALMQLAASHAVRFLHVCTCTNGADPFHMSFWEGVPLNLVLGLTGPKENVRRVYYQSYSNPGQPPFQSSLPMGQILESAPGEMPVIMAYKMNGQPIPASHGGPVRMVVPGAYGSKSIKWLQRIVLTNDYKSNDSDAELNNDPENALKTRARFINEPKEIAAGKPSAITGMAQVGLSGLKKVQFCVHSQKEPWPDDDPNRTRADWREASILPPPVHWGGGLPEGKLPGASLPRNWPLRYAIVHWAALLPGLAAGRYELCCRTIDGNGIAQPLPRTLPRTGFNALHMVSLTVMP